MVRGLSSLLFAALAGLLAAGPADETAGSFWVRFSDAPAACSPTNGLACSLTDDGRLALRFFASREEILGDWTILTPRAVSRQTWHHVAYSYSVARERAFLYLDGRWQAENGDRPLARLSGTGTVDTVECEVEGVKTFSEALDVDRLILVPRQEALAAAFVLLSSVTGLERRASAETVRPAVRNLDERLRALCEREESSDRPMTTVAELDALGESVRNLEFLPEEASTNAPASSEGDGRVEKPDEAAEKELLLRLLTESDKATLLSIYRELCGLYERTAMTRKLIAAYQGMFKVDPRNVTNVCALLRTYIRERDYSGALDFFEGRLGERASDPHVGPLLGDCRFYLGDYEGALGNYEPFGPSLDPGENAPPDRRDRLAACYYALGRYRDAMEALERCDGGPKRADYKAAARQRLKELIDAAD